MTEDKIVVHGAREHNLQNVNLEIPRNKLVVFTGLSGSGKSSLAFDTIYSEGQRRYIESLSAYARQFLGQMEKPDVDYIEGLSPAISIDQKAVSKNPRSTVGTITEIYDYLRVLYARIGKPYCPIDNLPIESQTIDQMIDFVLSGFRGKKVTILSPVIRGRKGNYLTFLNELYGQGYAQARVDKKIIELNKPTDLARYKAHTIEVLVDEVIIPLAMADGGKALTARLSQSLEQAAELSKGLVTCETEGQTIQFSTKLTCPKGHPFIELEPRIFSFNSPYGACTECHGLGSKQVIDPELIIPDKSKTIGEGGILPWSYLPGGYYSSLLSAIADHLLIKENIPIRDISEKKIQAILFGPESPEWISINYYGKGGYARHHNWRFIGLVKLLNQRWERSESDAVRSDIEKYMTELPCPTCRGQRLKPEPLHVKIAERNIAEVVNLDINLAQEFFKSLELSETEEKIGERLLKEITNRLQFLIDVGLGYLTLSRKAATLSSGETQRIRLASQIGSGLVGVLYVLDEPSIGLHQRDNRRLLETLKNLRDLGNTLIVIEHDEETIREADYVVDIGPGAGRYGGKIVAVGNVEDLTKAGESITGQYLSGKKQIAVPDKRRNLTGHYLTIRGATEHNLKGITAKIPLQQFVAVTGVSGSGKSTLVNDIIHRVLANRLNRSWEKPGKFKSVEGLEYLDKVISIDQTPIGRTPRSNPATYTKTFDLIRQLFAATVEARARGYRPGRFSFNVPGGRCERCQGEGQLRIEMHFLPDVYIPCDVCHGKRYNKETLEVRFKGKNIYEVLEMPVDEAQEFFKNIPGIKAKLDTLQAVGLGYIKLGQSATTLSGGEAQRIKLSSELAKRATGQTFYILDEPTTGLHFEDVAKLLSVLNRLVDAGNTVMVIEHNLDVIKTADYIIDLGPEGGDEGGRVIAAGRPEMVAGVENSYTGKFLKEILPEQKHVVRPKRNR